MNFFAILLFSSYIANYSAAPRWPIILLRGTFQNRHLWTPYTGIITELMLLILSVGSFSIILRLLAFDQQDVLVGGRGLLHRRPHPAIYLPIWRCSVPHSKLYINIWKVNSRYRWVCFSDCVCLSVFLSVCLLIYYILNDEWRRNFYLFPDRYLILGAPTIVSLSHKIVPLVPKRTSF